MLETDRYMFVLFRPFLFNQRYMPIVEERFSQSRIDTIRRSLQRESDRGKPRDYEIFVDGFKIVPRTDDLGEFDDYEQEIRSDTRNVSILLYDGPGTNRNTRYSFSFHDNQITTEQSPTLGDIDQIVAQKMSDRDREFEISRLKEKLQGTQDQLEESEEYATTLQKRIEELEQASKGRMMKWGDLGASILMGVLRSNAHKLPPGLSGFLDLEQMSKVPESIDNHESVSAVSYTKIDTIDEHTHHRLELLKQMQQQLNEQQIIGVLNIIGYLIDHPEQIQTTITLITENSNI